MCKFYTLCLVSIALMIIGTAWAQEQLALTTYYPAPYGVYRTLRLFPADTPATCQEGELYFSDGTTNPRGLYVCDDAGAWLSMGGFWTASTTSPNDIYNTNTGNVGIGTGTDDPIQALETRGYILSQGDNDLAGFLSYRYINDSSGPYWSSRKARGSLSVPGSVINDDTLWYLSLMGHDGNTWQPAAAMQVQVDGSAGSGDMPGMIKFRTTPDGSNSVLTRMVIRNNGYVGIGTMSPDPLGPADVMCQFGDPTTSGRTILGIDNNGTNLSGISFRSSGAQTAFLYRPSGSADLAIWGSGYGGNIAVFNTTSGKATFPGGIGVPGGIDPPYISFSDQSHKSIRRYAKAVEEHEVVMQFWNGKSHRIEVYVIKEDRFYTIAGEPITE